jgi:hypothetical protein
MNNTTTQVGGFITENDSELVRERFGNKVADALANCEGKTFLQILVENGGFDLTNKPITV